MKLPYIKKVKIVKITLLCTIGIIILVFLLVPLIQIQLRNSGYAFASKLLNAILKKEINPPVISGTTAKGGAYYLSAEKITNNFLDINNKEGKIITVTCPNLMYTTNQNKVIFTIKSNLATIDTLKHVILLPNLVNVTSNSKYRASLQDVKINIKEDSAQTNKPISAKIDNRVLKANGAIINQGGDKITLIAPVEIITINKPNNN